MYSCPLEFRSGKAVLADKTMMVTAKKESQKPGEITAIGSMIKMMSAAIASNWLFGMVFRMISAIMNTKTMMNAR